MPPLATTPASAAPAKTMFGYSAPVRAGQLPGQLPGAAQGPSTAPFATHATAAQPVPIAQPGHVPSSGPIAMNPSMPGTVQGPSTAPFATGANAPLPVPLASVPVVDPGRSPSGPIQLGNAGVPASQLPTLPPNAGSFGQPLAPAAYPVPGAYPAPAVQAAPGAYPAPGAQPAPPAYPQPAYAGGYAPPAASVSQAGFPASAPYPHPGVPAVGPGHPTQLAAMPAGGVLGQAPVAGYGYPVDAALTDTAPNMPPQFTAPVMPTMQAGPPDYNAAPRYTASSGTLFGFPLARLRDAVLLRGILFISGIALLAAVFIPWSISPTRFAWDQNDTAAWVVWPIVAGIVYLFHSGAPHELRTKLPAQVLKWAPFAAAIIGIMTMGALDRFGQGSPYAAGYALVVGGLVLRMMHPADNLPRGIIAAGAGLVLLAMFSLFDHMRLSGVPFLFQLIQILQVVMTLVAIAAVVFAIPAHRLPPALRRVEPFMPMAFVALLVWLIVSPLLWLAVGIQLGGFKVLEVLLAFLHLFVPIFAYWLVFLMTAPDAYDELKAMVARGPGSYPGNTGGFPTAGGPPPGNQPPY